MCLEKVTISTKYQTMVIGQICSVADMLPLTLTSHTTGQESNMGKRLSNRLIIVLVPHPWNKNLDPVLGCKTLSSSLNTFSHTTGVVGYFWDAKAPGQEF